MSLDQMLSRVFYVDLAGTTTATTQNQLWTMEVGVCWYVAAWVQKGAEPSRTTLDQNKPSGKE